MWKISVYQRPGCWCFAVFLVLSIGFHPDKGRDYSVRSGFNGAWGLVLPTKFASLTLRLSRQQGKKQMQLQQQRQLPCFWELTLSSSWLESESFLAEENDDVPRHAAVEATEAAPAIAVASVEAIRLNKVFRATHSRRQADDLIAQGRVSINETNAIVQDMGRRVQPFCDRIYLDGQLYTGWEERHGFRPIVPSSVSVSSRTKRTPTEHQGYGNGNLMYSEPAINESRKDDDDDGVKEDYIKFWKPVGVVSTTDRGVHNNLLSALEQQQERLLQKGGRFKVPRTLQFPRHRIFSVGRLDKDSSGLLLLTSDGRIPNAVLRKEFKQPKTYQVTVDKPLTDQDLNRLRQGIVITTDTVRNGKHIPLTALTLPCQVQRLSSTTRTTTGTRTGTSTTMIEMSLWEGRNRQIRVMLQTLGYHVTQLHRTTFMGIDLHGLEGPGDFTALTESEVELLEKAVQKMNRLTTTTTATTTTT